MIGDAFNSKLDRDRFYRQREAERLTYEYEEVVRKSNMAQVVYPYGHPMHGSGTTTQQQEEVKKLSKPVVSRHFPFDRLNHAYITQETILTFHRNRITVKLTNEQSRWLDENCQDIYTKNVFNKDDYIHEVMFLSSEDMALFLLKFA